jgi:crotonobetainyl-CoA:carnitine CoA-transferase CaiB-like acyl-CoA transferase
MTQTQPAALDPRFDSNFKRGKTNRAELMGIINQWSRRFTLAEVQGRLDEGGIPAARYNELPDVWEEPQVRHRGLKATTPHPYAEAGSVDLIASPLAKMSASPATIRRPPPMLGEHTSQVLGELGYDSERVAELQGLKVI